MSKRVFKLPGTKYTLTIMNDPSSMKNYFPEDFYEKYLLSSPPSRKTVYVFDDDKDTIVVINDRFSDNSSIIYKKRTLSYHDLYDLGFVDLQDIFNKILKPGSHYLILKSILNGTVTDEQLYKLERDPLVDDILYNQNNPKKSKIRIQFKDIESLLDTIESHMSEPYSDSIIGRSVAGGYYEYSRDFYDYDNEYLLNYFSDDNIEILKEIFKFTNYPLYRKVVANNGIIEDNKIEIWKTLLDVESNYSPSYERLSNIISEYFNNQITNKMDEIVPDEIFSVFIPLMIFPTSRRLRYKIDFISSVKNVIWIYDITKNYDKSFSEAIKYILGNTPTQYDVSIGGWEEEANTIYYTEDIDDNTRNRISNYLEDTLENIKNDDEYDKAFRFFEEYEKKYPNYQFIDTIYYLPNKNYKFKITDIDEYHNKIYVTVVNTETNNSQRRTYTLENFIDFLTSYELFGI